MINFLGLHVVLFDCRKPQQNDLKITENVETVEITSCVVFEKSEPSHLWSAQVTKKMPQWSNTTDNMLV